MAKRFRKPTKKNKTWAKWNEILDKHSLTIDLADIRHLSIKMKTTGFISDRVLNKWTKRDYSLCKHYCRASINGRAKHKLIPYSVVNKRPEHNVTFWWYCVKCHTVSSWVWDEEISEPLAIAYPEHIRTRRWE